MSSRVTLRVDLAIASQSHSGRCPFIRHDDELAPRREGATCLAQLGCHQGQPQAGLRPNLPHFWSDVLGLARAHGNASQKSSPVDSTCEKHDERKFQTAYWVKPCGCQAQPHHEYEFLWTLLEVTIFKLHNRATLARRPKSNTGNDRIMRSNLVLECQVGLSSTHVRLEKVLIDAILFKAKIDSIWFGLNRCCRCRVNSFELSQKKRKLATKENPSTNKITFLSVLGLVMTLNLTRFELADFGGQWFDLNR